jgi:hypothetical protein
VDFTALGSLRITESITGQTPEDISEVEEAAPIDCSTYLVQPHSIAYLFAQAAS